MCISWRRRQRRSPLINYPRGPILSMEPSTGWCGWGKKPPPAQVVKMDQEDLNYLKHLQDESHQISFLKMWTNCSLKRKFIKTCESWWFRKMTRVWSRNSALYNWEKEMDQNMDGLVDTVSSWALEPMDMTSGDIWWCRGTLNVESLNHPSWTYFLSWWANDPEDSLVLQDLCQMPHLHHQGLEDRFLKSQI